MLSLCELRRAARLADEALSGARLRRIVQPGVQTLLLTFEINSGKTHLLLSSRPEYARISLSGPGENTVPGSFCEYLRAHLTGGTLSGIEIVGEDRQVGISLQTTSGSYILILSILGARSNIYLLDSGKRLLHSMRPLEESRRELRIGEAWTNPEGTAPEGTDRWEETPDQDYLRAIEETYRRIECEREAELLRRRIEQALKKERAFLDRKAINLREDLGEAHRAEGYRKKGELLKSVLYRIRQGDEMVSVTDYETGEVIDITLDPKLSPAANLESYFARYQKVTRGARIIEQQISELEEVRSQLDTAEEELRKACGGSVPDKEALERLSSSPVIARLIKRYSPKRTPQPAPPKRADKKEIPARLLPKRYRTQDGLEIWVGRSDEGNDYLTTRLARGNDLFFHLEGYPGSHVVLRTEGRSDPPVSSILEACELAVHFSRMKDAGTADVHVAPIKNVKKPKGAKPGLVYVRSGKTIHLKRNPRRLESILASRE